MIRNIVRIPDTATKPGHRTTPSGPCILAVGRLSEEKNYPLLLDALELLFVQRPESHGVILGEGPMRSALEARIAASAVLAGRVSLPGYVSDVGHRLASANAYVSLSRFEGTPNTVLEAIVNGCPLLLSDIPAHREWLSTDEARWVALDNPADISKGIGSLLDRPEEATQHVMAARERLRAWSAERIAAQYIALYQQLNPRRFACASS